MKSRYAQTTIRIPVKLVDGKWEYFHGGGLPIKNGSIGDLVVDRAAIEDRDFMGQLNYSSSHKILDAGTPLLVALTIKQSSNLNDTLKSNFLPTGREGPHIGDTTSSTRLSADTRFVRITISGPTERQKRINSNEQGGVWIHLEGLQAKWISTSTVQLPDNAFDCRAESLNHAFTMLSESYEPWRKSHTGNIYDRIYYQEKNGKWYPLNVLRNAAIAKDEHQLIREQWARISKTLNLQMNTNG